MTPSEAKQLQTGDEVLVFWRDPDNGRCSRFVRIQTIEVIGSVVRIQTTDGDDLECLASELH